MEGEPGNRYLLTAAMTRYPGDQTLNRPELADDVERMAGLFSKDFGYTHVGLADDSPTYAQLRDGLRAFCMAPERGPEDFVAVYLACHGAILEPDDFVLLPSDINAKDPLPLAVMPQVLVDWMLRGTNVRRLLLMLDTCYSGQGGQDAAKAAVKWVNQPGAADRPGVVLVAATHPWQEAQPGVFSKAFERAVRHLATGGPAQEDLPLDAVVEVIRGDHEKPPSQTVTCHLLGLTGLQPAFLPNPRYRRQLIDADLLEQERARYLEEESARYTEQRETHVQQRFLPATRWFTGRHTALTDLAAWLDKPSAVPSALIVTGDAGSGKTALLGLLAVLSDPDRAPAVPRDGLPESFAISGDAIAEVIYAGTMTTGQVRDRVADAAGVRVKTTQDLIDGLSRRDRPLVVLVDALDEAADPGGLISGLLSPLMTKCADTLRLLLGTRRHLLTARLLGTPESGRYLLVDLDSAHYADPASVRAYIRRILLADDPLDSAYRPSGVYRTAPSDVVDAVTEAIGQAAGSSFLVARITATTESTASKLPDPNDPAWRTALPQRAGPAMRRDLSLRLDDEAGKAETLLLPLAYAQGNGLPWEGIWPHLVEALSPGSGYDNNDLTWLRKTAGSYAVEGLAYGRSAYRLYHQALTDHLLEGRDQRADQRAITDALITLDPPHVNGKQDSGILPTSRSASDWSGAHPYVRAHLATHAQRAGMLDSLLLDPGFLINAEPAGLLAALPAAQRPDAQLAGRAYQRAVYQLQGQPEDYRYSYLELASRISDAVELANRIVDSAPHRRWSVPWTHWPRELPHRVLAGRLGQVNGILCINLDDGKSLVASIGEDASLRIWDVVTAQPRGIYTVGDAPLVAARAVRLPKHGTAIMLLAADGILYLWDIATTTELRRIPTTRSWRRLASIRNPNLTLRCLAAPDGQPFAVVGGRRGRASLWDLSTGRRVTHLPWGVAPETVKFATLTNGKFVVIASLGGTRRCMYDLQTGRELPHEHRRIPFPWLRTIYDAVRLASITYYAFRDGTPAVAVRVRFRSSSTIVWDLTNSSPLDAWRRDSPYGQIIQVRLQNGRIITIQPPSVQVAESNKSEQPGEDPDTVIPLHILAKGKGRPDSEARESLSPQLETRGRFLNVKFDEGRRVISLTLAGHTADVTWYDWTRLSDGHVVVITASRDGTVRTWDVSAIKPESGEEDEQAKVALHKIVSVRLQDGTPLGLTLARHGVGLWDLRNGNFIGSLGWRTAWPRAVGSANSAIDTPTAVTFDSDGMMRRWNLPDCRLVGQFPVDRLRWPSDVAFARLTDGTGIAVTSGHGRRIAVWDVSTGRIRNVLTGHKGWSACVACAVGPGLRPIALTGGYDNRVNIWDLRRGRRHKHFRIVPPWTFLASPPTGRAHAMWTLPLDGGRLVALVATSDGMVRALEPRRFPWGVRRMGVMPADAADAAVLSNGRAIVATAGEDGIVRIWKPEVFTDGSDDNGLLCEMSIEVPVSDISFADHDTLVVATPNGLTAIKLDAALLEKEGSLVTNPVGIRYGADYIRRRFRPTV